MATVKLDPPSWATREGTDGHHLGSLGSARLTTTMPSHLKRRGFLRSWPAGAVVEAVAGVPSDANTPPGTTIAQNTNTGTLYRKENGVWKSVNGNI